MAKHYHWSVCCVFHVKFFSFIQLINRLFFLHIKMCYFSRSQLSKTKERMNINSLTNVFCLGHVQEIVSFVIDFILMT